MDSKKNVGVGAALAGAFVLGAVCVAAFSFAQQSSSDGAATATNPGAPTGAAAAAPREPVETSFSDQQEDEIRALVHDYLMTNPEVIIEAVNAYSQRQREVAQQRALDGAREHLAALLNPEHGFVAGKNPDKAKVAVIELFDYHCGYCKRAAPLVKQLMESEEDVKVVFREYPILREESDYAAEMSLAARDQDKFLDLHFAMMKAQGTLTKDRIKDIAAEEGVSFAKLEKSREAPEVSSAIIETIDIAQAMGVDGTPAFIVASLDGDYVNVIHGFDPQRLVQSIEDARAAS